MDKRVLLGLAVLALLGLVIVFGLNQTGFFLAPVQEQKILVGLTLPLSGSLANIGEPIREGVEDSFKANGDKIGNYSVQLIVEDDAGDSAKTVSNYQFFKSVGVNSFFVAFTKPASAVNPDSIKDKKIMMFLGTATSIPKSNPYAFKHHYNAVDEAKVISTIVGNNSSALVYNSGENGEVFKQEIMNRIGGKISSQFMFDNSNTDFKQIIVKLKDANIQAPLFFGYPANLLNFAKQSRELGYEPKYIGVSANTFPETVNAIEQYYNGKTVYVFSSPFQKTDFDYTFGYQSAELLQYGMNECLKRGAVPDDAECLKETMINATIQGKFGQIKTDEFGIVDVGSSLYTVKDKKLLPFEAS